jgi:S1-C subfamily serine protease
MKVFFKHLVLIVCCWVLTLSVVSSSSCDKPFSEVFQEVSPSVVRIFSVAIDPFSVIQRVKLGVGTGLVIDDEGHIVTNAHIVYGASEVFISIGKNDMHQANIVGVDPVSDLAVIKLKSPLLKLPKVRLDTSGKITIGEEVLAVGYPLGIGKTATRGIISAMEQVIPLSTYSWMTPFIQTDAAISPGNSGGPLVNRCGEIIGINTLYAEKGQNINFAIPIDLVSEFIPQLIKEGRVIRAWHGINGRIVPPQLMFTLGIVPGFMVETIEPGSPAEKINLHGGTLPVVIGAQEYLLGGDVITKVNGEPLTSMETVARIARSLKVGDKIKLEYWSKGKIQTAEVILPERPILSGDVRRFQEQSKK